MHFKKTGFTLIELSIVLTIIATLIAGGVQAYNIVLKNQRMVLTKQRLADIKAALEAYKSTTGYYPCPAARDAAPDTASYAVASDCTATVVSPGVAESTVGSAGTVAVRTGSVPGRTLNLPGDEMEDAWGKRFTYAVVKTLAVPSPSGSGAINVVDSGGFAVTNPASSAPYVIVSHGSDGVGAYTHAGKLSGTCSAVAKDGENCNDDGKFVYTTDLSIMPGGAHYDDLMAYGGSSIAAAPTTTAGSWHKIVFSTPGTTTWTLPSTGVSNVSILTVGGGGGGAGGNDGSYGCTSFSGGSGGGGGGVSYASNIPVTGNLTVTVGVGAPGNPVTPTAGGVGGKTSVYEGSLLLLSANGGGTASACYGGGGGTGNLYNGAAGGGQTVNCCETAGGSSPSGGFLQTGATGGAVTAACGAGGSWGPARGSGGASFGNGGDCGVSAPVGGGGGGGSPTTPGAGGTGYVVIWAVY